MYLAQSPQSFNIKITTKYDLETAKGVINGDYYQKDLISFNARIQLIFNPEKSM